MNGYADLMKLVDVVSERSYQYASLQQYQAIRKIIKIFLPEYDNISVVCSLMESMDFVNYLMHTSVDSDGPCLAIQWPRYMSIRQLEINDEYTYDKAVQIFNHYKEHIPEMTKKDIDMYDVLYIILVHEIRHIQFFESFGNLKDIAILNAIDIVINNPFLVEILEDDADSYSGVAGRVHYMECIEIIKSVFSFKEDII
jgi:hypothetical protein